MHHAFIFAYLAPYIYNSSLSFEYYVEYYYVEYFNYIDKYYKTFSIDYAIWWGG